jgi:CoA:oxalate CoA-transferase
MADVVIQNFLPGVMERFGLGYEVLKSLNPGIIYAALSGFGQTGPYRERPSFANIAEGISGHSRLTGDYIDPHGPPGRIAEAYGDLGPALFAAMSIIAAIRYRDRTGVGQMIDVAQADCMTALCMSIVTYTLTGLLPWQEQEKYRMLQFFRTGQLKVKDGWIKVAGRAKAIDELRNRFGIDEINEETVGKLVADMSRDEAVNFLVEVGLPVAPVYNVSETVKDLHLNARGMFVEVEHPKAGKIKVPNFPVKFSETPGKHASAAPLVGQHTKEILMDYLGYSGEEVEQLEQDGVIAIAK